MARIRWFCLSFLLYALALLSGCDLSALPYLLSGADSRLAPEMQTLRPREKDKPARVLVMAHCGMVSDPQLMTADREVTRRIIRQMQKALQEPKEKDQITFISNAQTAAYKDAHPDWHLNLVEAGKHFHADYIIYLDFKGLTLYENKSYNQVLHARADVTVRLFDMREPDDPVQDKDYRWEYPRTAPVPVEDTQLEQFRNAFYEEIAIQVSWLFSKHETPSRF